MKHPAQLQIQPAKFHVTISLAAAIVLAALAVSPVTAQTLTVLHNFTGGTDGGTPVAGITFDQQGRIYGTTSDGGTRHGVVYRLVHEGNGWILTPLYTFRGQPDGDAPYAGVTFGPDGTLFGTTAGGGTSNSGTVFNLRPPASVCHATTCPWLETVIYSFTGASDGSLPAYGDLIFDSAGNIYGTTAYGGSLGGGVVFKLTRSNGGWTETVLWNFTGANDGSSPYNGLIFDNAGNLYGTASEGGANGYGVVYELSPSGSGWTQKTLYSFSGEDNGAPFGGLTADSQGNLYGTTGGFFGFGEAFELTLSDGSWAVSRRQTFTEDYDGPFVTPALDAQGNLYGTIEAGGLHEDGEVFKLTPSGDGWLYTDSYDFNFNSGGVNPIGNVIFDAGGNLYGTNSAGGQNGYGTVWEITP